MNTTDNPDPTTGPNLKKRAGRALLAGGLTVTGLGLGLGAGTASAGDQVTMTCPGTVTQGTSGTVTVAGFPGPSGTDPIFVSDGPDLEKYVGPGWGTSNGAIAVTWPNAPLGPHTLTAWQISQAGSATCTVVVVAPLSNPGVPDGGYQPNCMPTSVACLPHHGTIIGVKPPVR
ncbi:hypothetical protein BOO86_05315 [Mycobacterium sp. CBMA 234]|uniref:hypothetical protein n=1 Tax=Mycolicibacterium sp. CBMA 234 TaxID=1918495 RepID=UPI0012DC87BE|nr:hypothetical protein [Mycolicibacterium sp. CBMA 234]MUL63876.1 hypothetical protein [Mycolicibacterium sp. CBMA 234]